MKEKMLREQIKCNLSKNSLKYKFCEVDKNIKKEYVILEKIGISNNFNNFKIYYKTMQIYFHNRYNFLAMYINFFLEVYKYKINFFLNNKI